MELFYNPERMTEREIKETFVAHQWLVDEIISILKRQPDGPGVQHVVIVAPRGMGKTTMLLMLRFTVLADDIGKQWQPIIFPEESYGVNELADLWIAALNHLASETQDSELNDDISAITSDAAHLEETALARIKNWRTQNGKRLMLLIDNFDMILDQIGDERENARLRDVLINDGTLMLVGGAPAFFKEARAYDQPLYNLFKIYNLNSLDRKQIRDLLRRRAELDGKDDFDETLRKNESRIRVLEYFTGGNPRLVLMLYRIITHSDISEVRRGLEKLLDEVTPYYKAKIEGLPPQQRKILDQIARSTSRTREGMTPTEIATETRLPVNQVSSQLKRLSEAGYVRAANIRARSSYYTLSEPLYAIWHQMRFGRDARKRMKWLVTFLKNWYDAKELGTECEHLLNSFRSYMTAGLQPEARNVLEHSRYLMEAIDDSSIKANTLESIVLNYLELSDIDTLKSEVLVDVDINNLSLKTRKLLDKAGLITDDRVKLRVGRRSDDSAVQSEVAALLELADIAFKSHRFEEAKTHFQSVLKIDPFNRDATVRLTAYSASAGDLEPLQVLLFGIEKDLPPGLASAVLNSINAFSHNQTDESLSHLDQVLKLMPDFNEGWALKAATLRRASRFVEAVEALSHIEESERDHNTWGLLGMILSELNKDNEALEAVNEAIRIVPDFVPALRKKSKILLKLEQYEAALEAIDRVLSIIPGSSEDWLWKGAVLLKQESVEEALQSFDRAVESDLESNDALILKALTLDDFGRTAEGLRCVTQMLERNPKSADAFLLRGILLASINPEESKASFKNAFDLEHESHSSIFKLSTVNYLRVAVSAENNDLEKVKSAWYDLMQAVGSYTKRDDWLNHASDALRAVALAGHWSLARELIISSNLDEELFPLTRALDYLLSKDEALIEKLSPEVRQIVDEIIITLRPQSSGDNNHRTSRSKKSKVSKQAKNR